MSQISLDIFRDIFHILDFKELIIFQRVCKIWKKEIEIIWYSRCKTNGYLEDEDFWKTLNRDWKWIFRCKFVKKLSFLKSQFLKE